MPFLDQSGAVALPVLTHGGAVPVADTTEQADLETFFRRLIDLQLATLLAVQDLVNAGTDTPTDYLELARDARPETEEP